MSSVEASTKRRWRFQPEGGFTIAEILAATGVLMIGMVALLTSMTYGVSGMDQGRKSTTASFLAEQRLEQIKAFSLSTVAGQGWVNLTAANFPAEAYGTIAGYTEYRRTVTITDIADPDGIVRTKQVAVQVFFRPVAGAGLTQETSALVSTLMIAH